MKQLKALSVLTISLLCLAVNVHSQHTFKEVDTLLNFPHKVFETLNRKNEHLSNQIQKRTTRYLMKMSRLEARMKRKLGAKDSAAAARIFGDVTQQYTGLRDKINRVSENLESAHARYVSHLDSLGTALKFIKNSAPVIDGVEQLQAPINEAIKGINVVQHTFSQAGEISNFVQRRKSFLQDQLAEYGLNKDVKQLSKKVYYYQAQVHEYRKVINDPSRLEETIIKAVKRTAAFEDFFNKHSQIASLFRMPGNDYADVALGSDQLQTRSGIGLEITQRFGSGPDVQQMMQQKLIVAQSLLNQIKEKINKAGIYDSNLDMPDFKPNHQKTKKIRERLEFGANIQTVKASRLFPSTSDIGLSVGYKLNSKSIAGVGGSYKMGWGKDIRHISISHQGLGLRSFFDYRIKGGFWASGGTEFNYRSQFRNFEILNDYNAWQKSVLAGLSKKYQVGKKFKGNLQMLYDFLWKQQVVRGQPLLFRVGYTL